MIPPEKVDKSLPFVTLLVLLKLNLRTMRLQIIGIKQLHKELKRISQRARQGESFLVVKNSKAVFKIEPIEPISEKRYTLEDFKKLQFETADKKLSEHIDEIVYGV